MDHVEHQEGYNVSIMICILVEVAADSRRLNMCNGFRSKSNTPHPITTS